MDARIESGAEIVLKPVKTVPVPGVTLLGGGALRVGDRLFRPGATVGPIEIGGVRVHRAGTAGPIVLTHRGHTFWLRFQDGGWFQETSVEEELAATTDTAEQPALAPPAPALRQAAPRRPAASPPAPPPAPLPLPDPFGVRALRFLWSVKATLVVLLICTVTYGLWATGAARNTLLAHATFTETHWANGQYHVLLTHGFLNERGGELALWLAGILLFGAIVETNVGPLRVLLLAAFCSSMGVLGYALFNTPEGYEWTQYKAAQLYWWIFEKWGYEKAQLFADGFAAVVPLMAWSTPLYSSAAVCAGFITFGVCRRTFDDGISFRRWNLLLAVAFLVVALAVCWPKMVGTPIPYVLLFGGALGGLTYIFPDKALNHFAEWLRERRSA